MSRLVFAGYWVDQSLLVQAGEPGFGEPGFSGQIMSGGLTVIEIVRKIQRALRSAAKLLQSTSFGRAALAGIHATARSFGKILHQLWLEVTGFIFLAMAVVGAMAGVREYGKYQSGHATGPGRLLLAICFTATFAWFGVSSFWRVNRKRLKAKS